MRISSTNQIICDVVGTLENLDDAGWAVAGEFCPEWDGDADQWFSFLMEDLFCSPVYDETRARLLKVMFSNLVARSVSQLCEGVRVQPRHALAALRLSGALSAPNDRWLWSMGVDDIVQLGLMADSLNL